MHQLGSSQHNSILIGCLLPLEPNKGQTDKGNIILTLGQLGEERSKDAQEVKAHHFDSNDSVPDHTVLDYSHHNQAPKCKTFGSCHKAEAILSTY